MKKMFIILILFSLNQNSFSQWRQTTQQERNFSKQVMQKLEPIIFSAAGKMKNKWSFEFEEKKKNALEGPMDIDDGHARNNPYEVRSYFRLYFENEEWEKLNFDERINSYAQTVDSLNALGETEKIMGLTNPDHELEVYIMVVVNNFLLSGYQSEGMYLPRTPEKNQKFISAPGTILSSILKYPGNSDSPLTTLLFGEIYFDDYRGKTTYGAGRNFSSTDIKHIGIYIHTSEKLAEEFYKNLDISSINDLINNF